MIGGRRAALVFVVVLAGCGGRSEEAPDASTPQPVPSATPDVRVEVSGSVTLIYERFPHERTVGPAARRVILVRPGGRFSVRDPKLADADVAVEAESSKDGAYRMWAPPGDYLIFAIGRNDSFANDAEDGRGTGEVTIRLEAGKPIRRDLFIYDVEDPW